MPLAVGISLSGFNALGFLYLAKFIAANVIGLILALETPMFCSIGKELGVLDNISSPTFSLVNEYQTSKNKKVFHFDFYRIEDENEALDIGIEEYFDNNAWCLVEWPENIENLLPLDAVQIHLSILDDEQRNIQLK